MNCILLWTNDALLEDIKREGAKKGKRNSNRYFPVNNAKFLRAVFYRTPPIELFVTILFMSISKNTVLQLKNNKITIQNS